MRVWPTLVRTGFWAGSAVHDTRARAYRSVEGQRVDLLPPGIFLRRPALPGGRHAERLVDSVLLVVEVLAEVDVGHDLLWPRCGRHHPDGTDHRRTDHRELPRDLHEEARPRVEPDRESHPVGEVPRVPSEVLEDPAVEELDELVCRVRQIAGGLDEPPLILLVGTGR